MPNHSPSKRVSLRMCLCLLVAVASFTTIESSAADEREHYELRIYRIFDFDKQQIAQRYMERALIPALNRMGIDRVGVFTNLDDENDHSIFMLITYPSLEKFSQLNQTLANDAEYQSAAAEYFDHNKNDPVYERIESRLMRAFSGMPIMEVPDLSENRQERMFELRLYESPTEDHGRRKVKMFNDGEIQIMRDVNLRPLFYGETLVGPDVPNLIYMLCAPNIEAHQEHFKAFLEHPEWKRIKDIEEYKGTVSKIEKWNLKPTSFSQL